ncbi:hypothetical protein SAMN05660284_01426 [Formivibrio citricus]|uniref:Uncharacterized protein n=1 Tax=Formivibrio citricus TaxID=83765 RepID=A0A1I4YRQ6_9NEIS|nr:hypothetical protein SAMN05660284_01426 [Formivibrio citricus]
MPLANTAPGFRPTASMPGYKTPTDPHHGRRRSSSPWPAPRKRSETQARDRPRAARRAARRGRLLLVSFLGETRKETRPPGRTPGIQSSAPQAHKTLMPTCSSPLRGLHPLPQTLAMADDAPHPLGRRRGSGARPRLATDRGQPGGPQGGVAFFWFLFLAKQEKKLASRGELPAFNPTRRRRIKP